MVFYNPGSHTCQTEAVKQLAKMDESFLSGALLRIGDQSRSRRLRARASDHLFNFGGAGAHWGLCPSGRSGHQLRSPAETDPLLKVVGEAGPDHLTAHLLQTPHPKLPQPDLGFEPGVGKLGHGGSHSINSFGRLGLHLLHKSRHPRHVFRAHDMTRSRSATALGAKNTSAALTRRRL